jgi:hypothetical protein
VNIARVEEKLVVISEFTGVPVYDFNLDLHFRCTHPQSFRDDEPCVLRVGPILDYEREFRAKVSWGLRVINSPAAHASASELAVWYPKLADLTPRSIIFDRLPSVDEIEASFTWPVFLKGSRQTSRHDPEVSIITGADHYREASKAYLSEPILHWQRPVVREFVSLTPVEGHVPGKIRPSLEFRSFWWRGRCVGWGPYWYQVPAYKAEDVEDGLSLAEEATKRLQVPSWLSTSRKRRITGGL